MDTIIKLEKEATRRIPGVGINRTSQVKEKHVLFEVEAYDREKQINLYFLADNLFPKAKDSLILANSLKFIKEMGLQIGGRKSVGLGLLKLNEEGSMFYIIDLTKDQDGTHLANPFKNVEPLNFDDFLKWIENEERSNS